LAIFIVVEIANKLAVHILVAPHLQVALQLYNGPIAFASVLSKIKSWVWVTKVLYLKVNNTIL